MTLRNYVWLALVVFLLGLAVLHQGWNRAPLSRSTHGSMGIQQQQNPVSPDATGQAGNQGSQGESADPCGSMKGMGGK